MKQSTLNSLYDFQKLFPAKKSFSYRPIIVWAMNDMLHKDELKRQLISFKNSGYGGVMVMPWGCLPYDFMSDQWLDAVRYILQCAKQVDIDIWIWDDWLFGSGPAGGKLTQNPAYRAKTLKTLLNFVIEPGETANFVIPPRAISGSIFSVNKFGNPIDDSFEPIDINSKNQITVKKTETRKRITIVGWEYMSGMQHSTRSHGEFADPAVSEKQCDIYVCNDLDVWSVDMLKPEAIAQYVKLIHQRYWDAMPEFFGNTLKGFFYDEPKVSARTPWTEDFAERFKKIKGYDIAQYLPSIMITYLQDDGNFMDKFRPADIKKAQADYRDVWTTLLAETFYGTVQSWCKEHKVIATGHPIGDNSLEEVLSNGGCYFKNMAFSDMPGVDTVGGFNNTTLGNFFDFPRFSGSRAALLGKPRAMSESFAVYGHGVDIDQMRYVCEHQIIRGVNAFFCKLSNYNREKSFYFHPPELSDFNPIIKHFGTAFCKRINNVASLMNSGTIDLPKAALYVSTSNYYYGDAEIAKRTAVIAEKLAYNQIEFDYVWDNDIVEMTIKDDMAYDKFGKPYSYVILPHDIIAPSAIMQKLELLKQKNAILKLPENNLPAIVDACKQQNGRILKSVSADVEISIRTVILEQGIQCFMLLNESNAIKQLAMESAKKTKILEINPDTEQIEFLTDCLAGTPITLEFAPSQSRFFICDIENKFDSTNKKNDVFTENILIEKWTLETPDGKKLNLTAPLPDWKQLGFGGFTGFMRYSCEFLWDKDCEIAMLSLGELRYAAAIRLDSKKIGDCVFSPFKISLGNLNRGKHLLEIDVLNTLASSVFGDVEKLKQLRSRKVFKGTYAPLYEKLDMTKLRCGLLGPVKLMGQ
ncbi:MAG: glycosyl hydrolase [Sedimentisphaerales bacterium]